MAYDPEYQRRYTQEHRVEKAKYMRTYYQENKDRLRQQKKISRRKWRMIPENAAKERLHSNAWKRRKFLKHLGVTEEEVAAAKKNQDNKCAICNQDKHLYLDHCHNTGKFRAWLCMHCNTAIGLLDENGAYLASAVAYLDKHRAAS